MLQDRNEPVLSAEVTSRGPVQHVWDNAGKHDIGHDNVTPGPGGKLACSLYSFYNGQKVILSTFSLNHSLE